MHRHLMSGGVSAVKEEKAGRGEREGQECAGCSRSTGEATVFKLQRAEGWCRGSGHFSPTPFLVPVGGGAALVSSHRFSPTPGAGFTFPFP